MLWKSICFCSQNFTVIDQKAKARVAQNILYLVTFAVSCPAFAERSDIWHEKAYYYRPRHSLARANFMNDRRMGVYVRKLHMGTPRLQGQRDADHAVHRIIYEARLRYGPWFPLILTVWRT